MEIVNTLFGLELSNRELGLGHLVMRGLLIYFGGTLLVRIHSQFVGITTPFNFMLNFILGSVLANAIIGEIPYFTTLGMALCIAFVNWFIAWLCFYSPFIEKLFKGQSDLLVKDGKIIWDNMRKNLITRDELLEEVHRWLNTTDISQVKKAIFENGEITIIKKKNNAK